MACSSCVITELPSVKIYTEVILIALTKFKFLAPFKFSSRALCVKYVVVPDETLIAILHDVVLSVHPCVLSSVIMHALCACARSCCE